MRALAFLDAGGVGEDYGRRDRWRARPAPPSARRGLRQEASRARPATWRSAGARKRKWRARAGAGRSTRRSPARRAGAPPRGAGRGAAASLSTAAAATSARRARAQARPRRRNASAGSLRRRLEVHAFLRHAASFRAGGGRSPRDEGRDLAGAGPARRRRATGRPTAPAPRRSRQRRRRWHRAGLTASGQAEGLERALDVAADGGV